MVIEPFQAGLQDAEWDALVGQSAAGTMLHTRRFLSYHGDRFDDRSLLIRNDSGDLLAVFPAAIEPTDAQVVCSHPGATFGGILLHPKCLGEQALQVLQCLANYYAAHGFRELRYKAVPHIYHRHPAQDDLYALFRMEARRYRCDLSATIDLEHRGKVGSRRKRGLNKARKAGAQVKVGKDYAAPLWKVLEENLARKHGARPVHSLEEILLLHERFPENIEFAVALVGDEVVAGVVLFESDRVAHAQYIASSPRGQEINALDMVFDHCIVRARDAGKRYFDFGISNERAGMYLNEGLYRFKCEFGASGVAHEFYSLRLEGQGCR